MAESTQSLSITGMVCDGCMRSVARVLAAVPGVRTVALELESGRAEITGTAVRPALAAAIEAAGYGVAG
jgi:copper chaperone CopZ